MFCVENVLPGGIITYFYVEKALPGGTTMCFYVKNAFPGGPTTYFCVENALPGSPTTYFYVENEAPRYPTTYFHVENAAPTQKHEENQLPGGTLNQLVTLGSKMPRRVAQNARFERFQQPPQCLGFRGSHDLNI